MQTILITGANQGIGKSIALGLAQTGARIVMLVRDPAKGHTARQDIIAAAHNPHIDLLICDLSSQQAIREAAARFNAEYERLDVLVNNAAYVPPKREITVDGIEVQLAVNHLAPMLLTHLLLDKLKASAPARVVNISSVAHKSGRLNFDDLQAERRYRAYGWEHYCNVKLMNLLWSQELARRSAGSGVTVNAAHPGYISTNLQHGNRLVQWGMKLFRQTTEDGAVTPIYLATSPEVANQTGGYYEKSALAKPKTADPELAAKVWAASAEMLGMAE